MRCFNYNHLNYIVTNNIENMYVWTMLKFGLYA